MSVYLTGEIQHNDHLIKLEYKELVQEFEKIRFAPIPDVEFQADINGNTRLKYVHDLMESKRFDDVFQLYHYEKVIGRNMLGCIGKFGLVEFMARLLRTEPELVNTEFVFKLVEIALENSQIQFVLHCLGYIENLSFICRLLYKCFDHDNVLVLAKIIEHFKVCRSKGAQINVKIAFPDVDKYSSLNIFKDYALDACISFIVVNRLKHNDKNGSGISSILQYLDSLGTLRFDKMKIKQRNIKQMMNTYGNWILCFLILRGYQNDEALKRFLNVEIVSHLILANYELVTSLNIDKDLFNDAIHRIGRLRTLLPFSQLAICDLVLLY